MHTLFLRRRVLHLQHLEDRTVPAIVGSEFISQAKFALPGLRADAFNPVTRPLKIAMTGETFLTDATRVNLTINGVPVPADQLTVRPHLIRADGALRDGKNAIAVTALTKDHYTVQYQATVWAGSRTLRVELEKPDGKPFRATAAVVAKLGDDPSVFKKAAAVNGVAVFRNLPDRTVVLEAKSGKAFGVGGDYVAAGTTSVVLTKVGPPSPIANNDLSLGTDGWNVGSAPVTIVDGGPVGPRFDNNNLRLSTAGEGPQSISRTFETQEDTSKVKVRYRFITSEVPGGYFGTKYNDYYSVSIRGTTKQATDGNTMNGLGLAAFDAGGATAWREVELPVNPAGDKVQVEATVANVADGLFGSQVEIDFIEEEKATFRLNLDWNTTAQGGINLKYEVLGDKDVETDTPIKFYWATGTTYASRLQEVPGAAVTVPAGTKAGAKQTVRVPGESLQDAPANATHILAATGEEDATALQDVVVTLNAGIDGTLLGAKTYRVLKNAARIAGERDINISSTFRSIESQVAAMFSNLTGGTDIEANIAYQLTVYGADGDQVIQVFNTQAAALDYDQAAIIANGAAIRALMVAEINAIKVNNPNAFKHTIDPTVYAGYNTIDVPRSGFTNANTRTHFRTAVAGMVDVLLDENNVYHLEITQ